MYEYTCKIRLLFAARYKTTLCKNTKTTGFYTVIMLHVP